MPESESDPRVDPETPAESVPAKKESKRGKNPESLKNLLKGSEPRPKVPLRDDPNETDLQAMEAVWLQQGAAKSVRQRSWVPLYKESAKAFRDRMDRLGAGQAVDAGRESENTGSPNTWDGRGPCPVCNRKADRITEDMGFDRVRELLTEEFLELEANRK